MCSTWGAQHYRMFDGELFQLPGSCNYVLASHCRAAYEDFNIQLRRSAAVIHLVTAKLDGTVLRLRQDGVLVNGQAVLLPFIQAGILVEKSGDTLKVTARLGLELQWKDDNSLSVEIDDKYMNQTCGLCGDFNGIQDNDRVTDTGVTVSPLQFGNLQKLDGPTELCEDPAPVPKKDDCAEARVVCEQVLSSPAFVSCAGLVSVAAFAQACEQDMCECAQESHVQCLCSTMAEYSRQCAHAGGQPENWRTPDFCQRKCPQNQLYKECGSSCPATCSNPSAAHICTKECRSGCFCPPGTVLDDITDKGCVPLLQCPCSHNGMAFSPGQSHSSACRICTCAGGQWSCQELDCPGTCSVEGGSHITSYDGKRFPFHGDCSYVLSKDCHSSQFTVAVEILRCGLTETETCLKSVTLSIKGRRTVLLVNSYGNVFINGLLSQLPLTTDNFTIFSPSSFYTVVHTSFGLQLQVQLSPLMQLYVTADPVYKGHTCGLCGDFNDVQTDDFKAQGGVVEGTAAAFANTWKSRASCPDVTDSLQNPCSLSAENEQFAKHWCSLLSSPTGPFAGCHATIPPPAYEANCLYDSCNCEKSEDCMCAVVSSYVHACAAKGITLDGWRSSICTKYSSSCPKTLVYGYSMTTCQRTCRSLSEPDHTCQVQFVPVDGCGCAKGTYMDEEAKCVPLSQCPCYSEGVVVPAGETITRNGTPCMCKRGSLQCVGNVPREPVCKKPMSFLDCSKVQPGSPGSECQKSCQTLDTDCFSSQCVSGCVCPEGLVSNGRGRCVSASLCPCVHNRMDYKPGDKIQVGCNTCTCSDRKWQCTETQCQGSCAIYGDGHFISFDGKRFSFDGDCEYTLSQDYCSSDPDSGSFRVITENIPCGTTGTTCSKAIKLFLGQTELRLSEGRYEAVRREAGVDVPYSIRHMGIYLVVEASNGLILMWDKKTSLSIKLNPSFRGKVCGLCGNYDGKGNNEFSTRSQKVVVSAQEFGNSWKVSTSCPDDTLGKDPCSSNPYRQSWAEKQCSIIKSPVFSACHSQVDPTPYYDACVHDSCACDSGGDCECFCTAVAAYAAACNAAAVCVAWRTPEICPLFCDFYNPPGECEWHYQPCGSPCMKTCRNPAGKCSNQIPGLEGCYPKCPPKKPFFDEDAMRCVARRQCGCFDANGKRYGNGEKVPSTKNCESCLCSMKGIACVHEANECQCVYQGQEYPVSAVIYSTTDGIGGCMSAICGANGTINREVRPCVTTTTAEPTTTFQFSTTPTPPPSTTARTGEADDYK
ncbi:mucin-5AC-like [Amia ocellicauda]|uniref:mucin-5AC-like n=1 Tax=Amia ocellicauda TaxID=2972642 RepID=UPI0034638B4B